MKILQQDMTWLKPTLNHLWILQITNPEKGKELYEIYCMTCHGAAGRW